MDATCPCALLLGHFPVRRRLRLTHPSRMRPLGIYFIVLPTRGWIKYALSAAVCLGRVSKMRLTLAPTHALRPGGFVLCGEVSSSSPLLGSSVHKLSWPKVAESLRWNYLGDKEVLGVDFVCLLAQEQLYKMRRREDTGSESDKL